MERTRARARMISFLSVCFIRPHDGSFSSFVRPRLCPRDERARPSDPRAGAGTFFSRLNRFETSASSATVSRSHTHARLRLAQEEWSIQLASAVASAVAVAVAFAFAFEFFAFEFAFAASRFAEAARRHR